MSCLRLSGTTMMVVGHGGVIDIRHEALLGFGDEFAGSSRTLNTSITGSCHRPPGVWRLVRYNDSGPPRRVPPRPEPAD